ncbi:MAG: hypothetical protein AAF617_11930 [Bacteroidota bacterium]
MKKIFTFLLSCVCVFQMVYSQQNNPQQSPNDTVQSQNAANQSGLHIEKSRITLGGGMFLPLGKLNQYIGSSPYFEFVADVELKGQKSYGFTFQAVIPNERDEFMFRHANDTLRGEATVILNFTFDFKKTLKTSPKSKLEIKFGAGFSWINTNARNPAFTRDNDEPRFESIGALLLVPSLEYTYKISEHAEFIFGLGLSYAPYRMDSSLINYIGGLALMPKLGYVF